VCGVWAWSVQIGPPRVTVNDGTAAGWRFHDDEDDMSGTDSDDRAEFLAKVRNSNAETEKFIAEQRKLIAEAGKFERERLGILMTGIAALVLASATAGGLLVKLLGH